MSSGTDESFEEEAPKNKKARKEPKGKAEESDSNSDDISSGDEVVEEEDDDEDDSDSGPDDQEPISKGAAKKTGGAAGGSSAGKLKNADGAELHELGNKRYVSISNFRGKSLVDIREYYIDGKGDGELKPGKKGISLTTDQWTALQKLMPEVNKQLKSAGGD